MGANGITWITPMSFFTTFVIAFGEIFLEYFFKILQKILQFFFKNSSYYFIKVHAKNLVKNVIFKKN
jgi:hypothetical protein